MKRRSFPIPLFALSLALLAVLPLLAASRAAAQNEEPAARRRARERAAGFARSADGATTPPAAAVAPRRPAARRAGPEAGAPPAARRAPERPAPARSAAPAAAEPAALPARRAATLPREGALAGARSLEIRRGALGEFLAKSDLPSTAAAVMPEKKPLAGRVIPVDASLRAELYLPAAWNAALPGQSLIVHFHGEPWVARQEADRAKLVAALLTVNLETRGSQYAAIFSDPEVFDALLEKARQAAIEKAGAPASFQWEHLCLSAWSSGYGAVRSILLNVAHFNAIEALTLADALHCDFAPGGTAAADPKTRRPPNEEQMRPFVEFAKLAAAGKRQMLITRSSILPDGYCGSPETAAYLIRAVGAEETPAENAAPGEDGRIPLSNARVGAFSARGYAGLSPADSMKHYERIGDLWRALAPSPTAAKPAAPTAAPPAR